MTGRADIGQGRRAVAGPLVLLLAAGWAGPTGPAWAAGPSPASAAAPAAVTATAAPAATAATTTLAGADRRPPVIVLLVDTVRGDHLGCAGHPYLRTPACDALARQGVRFTRCFSTAPWTLPAVASLYTGRIPYRHGAVGRDYSQLPESETTLAEHFRQAGYATAGFVASRHLDARFGMAQGFERFEQLASRHGKDGERVTAAGAEFIARHAGVPFLLLLHYFDAHAPYQPPAPFDRMYYQGNEKAPGRPILPFLTSPANKADARHGGMYNWLAGVTDWQFPARQYAAGVSCVDDHVGRVLDALKAAGVFERALVVLVADHGEHLGEHDIWFTHYLPYQETLHVPLLVKLPDNRQAGRVVETPVSSVDLLPTILALTGLGPAGGLDGRSLAGLLEGRDEEPRPLFAEQGALAARHAKAIVDWPWKLIQFRSGSRDVWELYDLSADPAETRDLADERPAVRQRLRATLRKTFDRGKPLVSDTRLRPATVDAETDRQLKALGY